MSVLKAAVIVVGLWLVGMTVLQALLALGMLLIYGALP